MSLRKMPCVRALLALALITTPIIGATAHADVLYTASQDFSALFGTGPGSTIDWQFEVPSVLTTTTTVTDLLSSSTAGDFSGCVITSVTINNPSVGTGVLSTSNAFFVANFASLCGPTTTLPGSTGFFLSSIDAIGTYSTYQLHTGQLDGSLTISSVPEPSSLILLSTGALGLFGPIRRKLLPEK